MPELISDLARKHCKNCEGAGDKLHELQINTLLGDIKGWEHVGDEIAKTYRFKNYFETMAFVNATAWISHREDHHPDLEVGYNKVRVRYSTHSVGGLSDKDFDCAAKVDALGDSK